MNLKESDCDSADGSGCWLAVDGINYIWKKRLRDCEREIWGSPMKGGATITTIVLR